MVHLVDALLMAVIILNFVALGSSRIRSSVRVVGMQGVILGTLPLIVHHTVTWRGVVVAMLAVLLKGLVIPKMLEAGLHPSRAPREARPFVGFISSLLLGAVGTGLALLFAQTLPLAQAHTGLLLVPASLCNVMTGFWILTTRRTAIAHVLGILVLENGVFTFGLLLLDAMPELVEAGVLLDVFVGVFLMGILLKHIDRELSEVDIAAEPMTILREE